MANLRHPVDKGVEDLAFLRSHIHQDFMEDDGVICDVEQGILIQFDQAVASMKRARDLEKAISLAVKQEGVVTRYTQQQFREAGLHIEALVEPDDAA